MDLLEEYIGREVVLDARAPIVYIGRLERADAHFFVLADVDVHDLLQGGSTKEKYVLETRKHGIRKNRHRVLVRRDEVVSLSRLEDVVEY